MSEIPCKLIQEKQSVIYAFPPEIFMTDEIRNNISAIEHYAELKGAEKSHVTLLTTGEKHIEMKFQVVKDGR